ncbi:cyclase family protein [Pendulispora albinea]|uniref:Cyclase family protein n=1 Tax=Pendulispora albinea TaxID=2741071 RepID=A0ABZ2LWV1_9BACT
MIVIDRIDWPWADTARMLACMRAFGMSFWLFSLLCLHACAVTYASPGRETFPRLGTADEIENFKATSRNWGRWGPHDERGTVNLITPETRKRAAGLVRSGITVSLAHALETAPAADVPYPLEHQMLSTGQSPESVFSADKVAIAYHGWSHTHLDALCHIFDKGKLYNGYAQELVTMAGCTAASIQSVQDGIFTRGVFIDMASFRGVPYLEPGAPISADDLALWEQRTGVLVEPGDAVVVRTGRWKRRSAVGPWDVSMHSAGLAASSAAWFKARGVSLVATDVGADVIPSGIPGVAMPVHQLLINTLGIHILDDVDPEALMKRAADERRVTFLFEVAPLAIAGGTGSPVNPLAIF